MVAGGVLLAHHGDVVVRAVHGRAEQVRRAGVQPDVFLVDVLFADGRGHQAAVRRQHEAAHFGVERHVAHSFRNKDFLVGLLHHAPDFQDVGGRLFRAVRHAHAAGEVDERDACPRFPVELHGEPEQTPGQNGVVFVAGRVAREERVNSEALCAELLEPFEPFRHLFARKAVFGVARVVHNGVAGLKDSARVVAAADGFRDAAEPVEDFNVGEVVQVDDGVQPAGQQKVGVGRLVGGEHDLMPAEPHGVGEHQLHERRAVRAAAFLPHNPKDIRVGGRLHGEVFAVSAVPGKSPVDFPRVFADPFFLVQVKRCGVFSCDFLQLFVRDKWPFHGAAVTFLP